jgi:hypothetical protein
MAPMSLQFRGRLRVVMQNRRVLKSGYEENYFHAIRGTVSAETMRGRRSCKTDFLVQRVCPDDAPSSFWDEVRTIRGNQVPAMMQKKANVKISKTKTKRAKKAKRESATKGRKSLTPRGAEGSCAHGESDATLIAQAVIGEGKKGAIGDRYVSVRSSVIYPPSTDTDDEDCLEKSLLARMNR